MERTGPIAQRKSTEQSIDEAIENDIDAWQELTREEEEAELHDPLNLEQP